jgi:flavin reductase (DIM6/NTAB) family NADH-FMN oxidoreductase RutF
MKRESIPIDQLVFRPVQTWDEKWFLLSAGEFPGTDHNCMTVSWGSIGVMWGKPIAVAVVRPSRHTYRFMERYADFTLCAFPEKYRDMLNYCGSRSGRDVNKVKECGITPITMPGVKAPGYEEAELILGCRKLYFGDFNPRNFLSVDIESNYNGRDYHRMFYGEILGAWGAAEYRAGGA